MLSRYYQWLELSLERIPVRIIWIMNLSDPQNITSSSCLPVVALFKCWGSLGWLLLLQSESADMPLTNPVTANQTLINRA